MPVDITSTIAYQAIAQRARNAQARVEQQRYDNERADKALSQLVDVGSFLGQQKQQAFDNEQVNARTQAAAAAALGQDAPQYSDPTTNQNASAAYTGQQGTQAVKSREAASKFNYDLQLKVPDWQLQRDKLTQDQSQFGDKQAQDESQFGRTLNFKYANMNSEDFLRRSQGNFYNNMANAEAGALSKAGDIETELFKKFGDTAYMIMAARDPQVMAQVQQMQQTVTQLKSLAAELQKQRQAGKPNVALEQQVTTARGNLARQAAAVDSKMGIGAPPQAPASAPTDAGPGNTSGGDTPLDEAGLDALH